MKIKKKILIAIVALIVAAIAAIAIYLPKINRQVAVETKNENRNENSTKINGNGTKSSIPSSTSSRNLRDDSENENLNDESTDSSQSEIEDNTSNITDIATQNGEPSDNSPTPEERAALAEKVNNAVSNASPITGPGYMNRDQMKSVASDFIRAYYNTSDWLARKQQLGALIDQDYISSNKNGLLYQDYFVHDAGENSLVHSYTTLKSIDDITIVNAKETSPIVEVKYTFTDFQNVDSGSAGTNAPGTQNASENTRTVSYKITLSSSYKVREFKFSRNYYH